MKILDVQIFQGDERRKAVIACSIFTIISTLAINKSDTTLSNSSDFLRQIILLINYAVTLVCIYEFSNKQRHPDVAIIIAVLFSWGLSILHTASGVSISLNFLAKIQLVLFAFFTTKECASLFKIWSVYMTVMALLGIIAYASFTLNLGIPYTIDQYYGDNEGIFYLNYGFSNIYLNDSMLRLCGLFNEPGVFGTCCALILCADKFNLRKIGNIILLVGAIFSFSLAAMLIALIYLAFISIKNRHTISAAVVLIGAFLVLASINSSNDSFDKLLSRVDIENRTINDDRTNEVFEKELERQRKSTVDYLFGYGEGANKGKGMVASSFKVNILEQGLIGTLLLYSLIFIPAFRKAKGNYFAVMFVFLLIIQQYNTNSPYTLTSFTNILCGVCYIKYQNPIGKRIRSESFKSLDNKK